MNLKVLLLVLIVTAVIAVIVVGTVTKAFRICQNTELFAQETDEEIISRMKDAKAAQDLKIGEIGGELNVDDPVNDAYLPYSFNVYEKELPSANDIQLNNNNEYTITMLYKNVFERSPTQEELIKNLDQFKSGELNEDLLRTYMYNSSEYVMKSRVQSNNVNSDLEYGYAKEDLIAMIAKIYFDELYEEVPKKILLPLRDMFMYFENDQYMFRAFLLDDNYKKFEDEVIAAKRLKKENILDVYRKYIKEDDLKLSANDIRKYDMLTKKNGNGAVPENLPVNTSFQGADLNAISAGVGAGSGAMSAATDVNQLTVDDLIKLA